MDGHLVYSDCHKLILIFMSGSIFHVFNNVF